MSKTVTVDELARDLPGYVSEVVDHGEHVFLKRGTSVVAEFRPVRRHRTLAELPALFEALPRLSPKEVDALEKDINESRDQRIPGLSVEEWSRAPRDPRHTR